MSVLSEGFTDPQPFQMVVTGDRGALIMPGKGALLFDRINVASITMQVDMGLVPYLSSVTDGATQYMQGRGMTDIDLSLIADGNPTWHPGKVELFDIAFFEQMTVRDLLKAVNRKINMREGEDDETP